MDQEEMQVGLGGGASWIERRCKLDEEGVQVGGREGSDGALAIKRSCKLEHRRGRMHTARHGHRTNVQEEVSLEKG